MSTQRLLPKMRKGISMRWSVLSLLAGVLIVCQLALSSVALAATPTPTFLSSQAQEALDIAGVSVVRLEVSYTAPSTETHPAPPQGCTGLGVLVGSWPSNTSTTQHPDFINWVLTDASLVTLTTLTTSPCAPPGTLPPNPPAGQLSLASIQMDTNAAYGGGTASSTVFGMFDVLASTKLCSKCILSTDVRTPAQGGVLFAFHTTAPQPFLSVASSNAGAALGIELTNSPVASASTGTWPASSQLPLPPGQTPAQFLAPHAYSLTGSGPTNEPGMPVVNSHGELTELHLSHGSLSASDLTTYMRSQPDLTPSAVHTNGLKAAWDTGVKDFYIKDYPSAHLALQKAEKTNSDFKALTAFEARVAAQQQNVSTTSPPPFPSAFFGVPSWVLAIVGLVVLLVLLILVSLSFGRKRAQKRRDLARFKADELEAQRMAEIEVQRQRQTSALGNRGSASNQPAQFVPDLRCPHCNYPVQPSDAYCPNCQAMLSPSVSGLHLLPTQPAQPAQPAQQAPDASWVSNYPLPPPQMSPQPVAYAQQPPSLVPASSISEQPTIEMSPEKSKNGQPDPERTVPYSVQQVRGRNLSLAVGSRSDPGIKRKHKPNEDSLFAVQGARTHNSQPQQFGLFVVADGMGGHANGQDASRLAIQTIIDYILPKVPASTNMDDAAFLKLLSDGVQCANEAVHQRNMEERADMGTTMTAAMVVGSTAYISNVGDSRTYLYREPEGLQKITRDHSVVASLVDAGIIQPDDIYTHPKRNQIYRSLGEKPVVEVDSFQVPLQPGDKLLLCSDGLWDMVRDPVIQRLMSNPAPDPNMTGNALIQAALDGGGEDNVSVIVVSITETSNRTGITGIQLLAKPDSVTVPEIPSI